MITPPIKERAATDTKRGHSERTVANELPDELSRLPRWDESFGVNSSLKRRQPPAHDIRGVKGGHPKNVTAVPKSRPRAGVLTTGFADDGHPTILAATCG